MTGNGRESPQPRNDRAGRRPGGEFGRALEEAVRHHQAGRLAQAEQIYRVILEAEPGNADALNLLGMIAHQTGNAEAALRLIDRAIAANDRAPDFHNNAGLVLLRLGRTDDAVVRFRRALALDPAHADAHLNLAGVALRARNPREAAHHFRRALKGRPDRADIHNGLGGALSELGEWKEAAASFRRALTLRPNLAEAHYNLATAYRELGRLKKAEASYRRAVTLRPLYVEAHANLAHILSEQRKLEEAEQHYRQAIGMRPGWAEGYFDLGLVQQRQDRLTEAEASFRRALELKPAYPEALCSLGNNCQMQCRLDEAADRYREALAVRPDFATAISNLLMTLCYNFCLAPEEIAAEHRRLGGVLEAAAPSIPPRRSRAKELDAERRLRIGYVSADLRRHSCAYFFEPLLAAHHADRVEVFCYSDTGRPDEVTIRLQGLAHHWRVIAGMSDDQVAARIADDDIDILVDLSGHTAGNRLTLFARRPAAIRVAWLGYPNTSGLAAIDYRLTDARADPEGTADGLHTERLIRLPDGFLCYAPPASAPEVTPGPAAGGAAATFGCFSNATKITPPTARLWADVLRGVPDARLVLKAKQFRDEGVRERVAVLLSGAGVPVERVEMRPWSASANDALAGHGAIDIALDTLPYNGTTTTCEALWMGVPVITLAGDAHAGRVGASLLGAAGLEEFVARSPEAYCRKAVALATERERLSDLRRTLRDRLRRSALLDRDRFARDVEAAYRRIWHAFCAAEGGNRC